LGQNIQYFVLKALGMNIIASAAPFSDVVVAVVGDRGR